MDTVQLFSLYLVAFWKFKHTKAPSFHVVLDAPTSKLKCLIIVFGTEEKGKTWWLLIKTNIFIEDIWKQPMLVRVLCNNLRIETANGQTVNQTIRQQKVKYIFWPPPSVSPVMGTSLNKHRAHWNSIVWIGLSHFACFPFTETGLCKNTGSFHTMIHSAKKLYLY